MAVHRPSVLSKTQKPKGRCGFALTKKKQVCYTHPNIFYQWPLCQVYVYLCRSYRNRDERVSTACRAAQRGNGWCKFPWKQDGRSPRSCWVEPVAEQTHCAGVGSAGLPPLPGIECIWRCRMNLGGTTEKQASSYWGRSFCVFRRYAPKPDSNGTGAGLKKDKALNRRVFSVLLCFCFQTKPRTKSRKGVVAQ